MRVSKYRVWGEPYQDIWNEIENPKKIMIYGVGLTPDGEPFHETKHFSTGITGYPIIKGVKMEWTGLKDKNGKEIFEGDIIKLITIFSNRKNKEESLEVKWEGYSDGEYVCNVECFMVGDYPLSDICEGFRTELKPVEVIGNIFENKDLLEEKKDEK